MRRQRRGEGAGRSGAWGEYKCVGEMRGMRCASAINVLMLAVLKDGKAGDALEVTEIPGDDAVTEFKRGHADDEVGEGDWLTALRQVSI